MNRKSFAGNLDQSITSGLNAPSQIARCTATVSNRQPVSLDAKQNTGFLNVGLVLLEIGLVSLFAFADLIKVFLAIEENTRATAIYMKKQEKVRNL